MAFENKIEREAMQKKDLCPECEGAREVSTGKMGPNGDFVMMECPTCEGLGQVTSLPLPKEPKRIRLKGQPVCQGSNDPLGWQ